MIIHINNARILDPETIYDEQGNLVMENGIITHITSENLSHKADKTIEADGKILCPALCDIFAGVSEAGGVHKDNFQTLTKAAKKSGISTLLIDPDTDPILDSPDTIAYYRHLSMEKSDLEIAFSASPTLALEGKHIADIGLLKSQNIVCLTHGDSAIGDSLLLSRIFTYAAENDLVIATMPEDIFLRQEGGIAHDSFISQLYGLKTLPAISEHIGLHRDILLAQYTGAKLHIRNLSSTASIDIIRDAKKAGVNITASVSIQHLSLNEQDIIPYKSFLKMRPPLRAEEDRLALWQGILDGTIDIIFSQHRPRNADSKRLPYAEADFGCSSVETLLPLLCNLSSGNEISLCDLLKTVTITPRQRFGLTGGKIQIGEKADLILFDPDKPFQVRRDNMASNATNTPYEGRYLQGVCIDWIHHRHFE